MPPTPFQRLILRAVLRDVYPMVIRLVAVADCVDLTDFDDIFHAVLGWAGGSGHAFHVHGQEFNSRGVSQNHGSESEPLLVQDELAESARCR